MIIIIGLMKIHDFSMGRLIGTSVLSLAGVAAIVFLVITIVIIVSIITVNWLLTALLHIPMIISSAVLHRLIV